MRKDVYKRQVQLFCALRQREGVLAAVEEQDRRFHLADDANGPRFADLHAGFQPGGPENFVQNGEDRPLFGLHVQLEGFQKRCEQAFNHEMGDIGRKVRLCGCQHDGGTADADAVQHHVAAAELIVREARPCDNVRPLACAAVVVFAFAQAVGTAVDDEDVAARLGVGLCEICLLYTSRCV